ncbi:hypothetical protein A8E22_07135, partial [Burkholderia cenocepacia]
MGEKAYGLSCIPSAWTLPFVVASSKLYEGYSRATPSAKVELISRWASRVADALSGIGISGDTVTCPPANRASWSLVKFVFG